MASSLLPKQVHKVIDCLDTEEDDSKCEAIIKGFAAELEEKENQGIEYLSRQPPLTPEERKIIAECNDDSLPDEVREKRGTNCFVSRVCPVQSQRFSSCMTKNNFDKEQCMDDAKDTAACWGAFASRWYSKSDYL